MLVVVKRNYIAHAGKLYGAGDTVDLKADVAARFLESGQAEKAKSGTPAAKVQQEAEPAATLPETDAAAAVVPAKKKK